MSEFNKEYLYVNGLPYRIITGTHRQVLNTVKNYILPCMENVWRILLVDELNDKYYNYEFINGELKRVHCICLEDFDREHHLFHRDMF